MDQLDNYYKDIHWWKFSGYVSIEVIYYYYLY